MESALDWRKEGPLLAVTKVATPAAARRLGEARLARWLKARGTQKSNALAGWIVSAAKSQKREMPATEVKAALVSEIASEILKTRDRLRELDERLEELVGADPCGEVIRSLPGMGLVLTAEFLAEVGDASHFGSADRLAAAYVPGKGYVGVGTVEEAAVPIRDFTVTLDGQSVPVLKAPLQAPSLGHDADDLELSEYAVRVDWERTVPVDQGIQGSGVFANPMIVCKLRNKFTLDRLTEFFDLEG